MNELKEKVMKMIDENDEGVLSTVQGNRPHARYMMFFHEQLQLYAVTSSCTHKIEEIKYNPHVHVLLAFQPEKKQCIEIEGVARAVDDRNRKEKFWSNKKSASALGSPEKKMLQLRQKRFLLFRN